MRPVSELAKHCQLLSGELCAASEVDKDIVTVSLTHQIQAIQTTMPVSYAGLIPDD